MLENWDIGTNLLGNTEHYARVLDIDTENNTVILHITTDYEYDLKKIAKEKYDKKDEETYLICLSRQKYYQDSWKNASKNQGNKPFKYFEGPCVEIIKKEDEPLILKSQIMY